MWGMGTIEVDRQLPSGFPCVQVEGSDGGPGQAQFEFPLS